MSPEEIKREAGLQLVSLIFSRLGIELSEKQTVVVTDIMAQFSTIVIQKYKEAALAEAGEPAVWGHAGIHSVSKVFLKQGCGHDVEPAGFYSTAQVIALVEKATSDLVKWQQDAFEVHPNIDIDIDALHARGKK